MAGSVCLQSAPDYSILALSNTQPCTESGLISVLPGRGRSSAGPKLGGDGARSGVCVAPIRAL